MIATSIFPLFFVLIFSGIALAQLTRPPLAAEQVESAAEVGLKGSVKKIVTRPLDPKSDEVEVHTFDRSGRLVEKTTRPWGDGVDRTIYRYDGAGRLVGYDGYADKTLAYTVAIKLDAAGLPAELTRTDHRRKSQEPPDWKLSFRYKLDSAGRVEERITTLTNPIGFTGGFIISFGLPPGVYREIFEYDKSGNEKAYTFYVPSPEDYAPFTRTLTVYDAKNRKIEETVPGIIEESRPGRTRITAHRYNEMGDIVETRTLEPITEATRREAGDRFKIIDSAGTVQNGNLISDRPNHVLWDLMECSYVYDSVGNWTAKTCTLRARDGNIPQKGEIRRMIEYYSK